MKTYTFKSSFATKFEHILPQKGKPTILYLHGFYADCWGKKPEEIKSYCLKNGLGMIRFEYAGHGSDSINFEKANFNVWVDQAIEFIDDVIVGDIICIGSSMGGWISLLLATKRPNRIKSVIGLATALNFVKYIFAKLSSEQKETLKNNKNIEISYHGLKYNITNKMIQTALQNCLCEEENSININCPITLIHGMLDTHISWQITTVIAKAITSKQLKIKLLKSSDHNLNDYDAISELVSSLSETIKNNKNWVK